MSPMKYSTAMPLRQCLIPGFITHVELDGLLGTSRTRQRWEVRGSLPKGRWIKGFGRRMGLYPEVVLARVVAGSNAGKAEDALNLLTRRSEELLRSELFGEIDEALHGVFGDLEHVGLRPELLECLESRQLLRPLEDEVCRLADEVAAAGILFTATVGRLITERGGMLVVESDDKELRIAAESALGFVDAGSMVAVERVRVGAREHDFVVPALHSQVRPSEAMQVPVDDALWDEMFGDFSGRPVVLPVLSADAEAGAGNDLVRPERRLTVRIPVELYAGANPMARTTLETAHA